MDLFYSQKIVYSMIKNYSKNTEINISSKRTKAERNTQVASPKITHKTQYAQSHKHTFPYTKLYFWGFSPQFVSSIGDCRFCHCFQRKVQITTHIICQAFTLQQT